MKTWVTINSRLFELETIPKEQRDLEWIKEWNSLLDMNKIMAGILKRSRYEIPEGEKGRKTTKGKKGKGNDVGTVQKDLAGQAALQ